MTTCFLGSAVIRSVLGAQKPKDEVVPETFFKGFAR
jgi:hypothetical protein